MNKYIMERIPPGARVLDIGCGNGDILAKLIKNKGIIGRGIDISEDAITRCIEKGVSVIHLNIDDGLSDYNGHSFDYVILNETLQVLKNPRLALKEAARVGKHVLVSFPNFADWIIRIYLLFKGEMPKSKTLPYEWYNTPNIHHLTIKDFEKLCRKENLKIIDAVFMSRLNFRIPKFFPNLFAKKALFLLKKR